MSLLGKTVKTIAVAVALSPLAGMSLASDEELYPIWWSPSFELENLDRIDERLERPFWPDLGGMRVYRWNDDTREEALVENCLSLKHLWQEGYGIGGTDLHILMYFKAGCEALQYLKHARPAKRSYLSGFVLDRKAFQFLPHMVDFGISCSSRCWQYYANEERIPMGEPEPLIEFDIVSDHEIAFKTDLDGGRMEILARADFNRDGSDDILLRSKAYVFDGTWGATDLFLLTRDAPESVLRVVNPDRYLCTEYQCDPADYYDQE